MTTITRTRRIKKSTANQSWLFRFYKSKYFKKFEFPVLKLNDATIFYLKELQEYDKRKNIISNYVASTSAGTRNTYRNLERSLKRVISDTDLTQNISLHTLGHTFGSALIRRGVSVEVVSKLMGHANIIITYNKYIHVLKEQKALAMDMIAIS